MAASTNDLLKKTGSNTVTTLSAPGKALGATSINVGSTTNYPTDTGIIIAIRQVDSSGALVAGTYTEWSATVSSATSLAIVATPVLGSDQIYAAGSTTQVYIPVSSYAQNKLIDNILEHANQDGTLITQAVRDALNLDSGSSDGWTPFGYSLTSITALGNRSYTAVVSGTDTTGVTSVGMRLKLPRTVTAPTQCADLEAGSSQYFSKASATGLSTGTTWTWKAKIKPESYAAMTIAAIDDGTNRMEIRLNASGQIVIAGGTAAAEDLVTSYQSVALGKVQDISGSITIGTPTGEIVIDEKVVPSFVTASAATTMTIGTPTIYIGRNAAGNYFDGLIGHVFLFNAIISAATLITYSGQIGTGSETSLEGYWSLNGVLTDASSNANTLTGSGGAVATNAYSLFTNPVTGTSVTAGTTNYGIIMAQTFSTNTTYTIQIPEGETLPTTGGIGTVSYSTQKTPYGFPVYNEKLVAEVLLVANSTVTSTGAATDIPGLTHTFTVPTTRAYKITAYFSNISMATGAPPAITLNLTDGSNNILTGLQLQSGGANYQNTTTLNSESMVLAAGSTTLKMRGTAASTFSLNSAAGNKTYLRIEEA